jgi:hypothetical protein
MRRSSPHRQRAPIAEERQELAALHELSPQREPRQYREMGGSRRFGSSAPNAARVLQRRVSVAPPKATVSRQNASRR